MIENRYNKYIDKKFNKLTVIKFLYKDKNSIQIWEFKCDCGKTIKTRIASVITGNTKSCGCLKCKSNATKELMSDRRIEKLKNSVDKHNTSGITGVSYDKYCDRWIAHLEIHGKKYREYCKNKNDAINARKKMEELYW